MKCNGYKCGRRAEWTSVVESTLYRKPKLVTTHWCAHCAEQLKRKPGGQRVLWERMSTQATTPHLNEPV